MEVVQKIKELINNNGITSNKLLTSCGLSPSTLDHWSIGKGQISLISLIKIAGYFGVSLDYLVGRDNAAPRPKYNIPEETLEVIADLDFAEHCELRGFVKRMKAERKEVKREKARKLS